MWQFAPNSVHYLLSLWQRMVASVPYVKATEPHLLETYTPEVSNAYITSRLESVAIVVRYCTLHLCVYVFAVKRIRSSWLLFYSFIYSTICIECVNMFSPWNIYLTCYLFREGLEDPLDDLGMVQQQLEQLSVIGRCEYQKTCTLLVQLFDQAARAYQELMATPNAQQLDITIQEGKCWQLR